VGGTKTTTQKRLALMPPRRKVFPTISPAFFVLIPGYLSGKLANGRTLHPPIARPSSTLVSSASLRAEPGSHSLIVDVHVDNG
jgi:hypothetical protein